MALIRFTRRLDSVTTQTLTIDQVTYSFGEKQRLETHHQDSPTVSRRHVEWLTPYDVQRALEQEGWERDDVSERV